MAKALFEQALRKRGKTKGWRVDSAGTWAKPDEPAIRYACRAMAQRGLDLESHRSKSITGELLRRFDLILVMEDGQREALQIEFPEAAGRVELLSSAAGPSYDIREPLLEGPDDGRRLADELQDLIELGFSRILALARGGRLS
jgi:protein-tyrosine phosphatase